jgi:hypothetical protein
MGGGWRGEDGPSGTRPSAAAVGTEVALSEGSQARVKMRD